MAGSERITRIAPGTFRVDAGGKSEIVFVAGPPGDRWAFWNGYVFRTEQTPQARAERVVSRPEVVQSLSAPMPATVIRLLVTAGSQVTQGDTILVLEAMKMELPIRAPSDGTVKAVRCREGELVKADQALVEIE